MALQSQAVDLIRSICKKYKNEPSPLMIVLSEVQKQYGYIPLEVQEIISEEKPIIYLYSPIRITAIRKKFKNIFPTSLSGLIYNYDEIFIETEEVD